MIIAYAQSITVVLQIRLLTDLKVNGPFVQTFCIEKDSYMDAIERVDIFK